MTLTTIAFTVVFLFLFDGWHMNAFMVNSHKSLMCGHLVLPCGKSSPLQRNNHTMTCQISRSLRMHSKGRIAKHCLDQTCVLSKCIKSCWNAGNTALISGQHLRNFFSCSPPFIYKYHVVLQDPVQMMIFWQCPLDSLCPWK